MSKRDSILSKGKKLQREKATAWGEEVWVWEMDGTDRGIFEQSQISGTGKKTKVNVKHSRAQAVVLSLRESGEDGAKLIFNPDDPNEVIRVSQLGASELDKLFDICARLSRLPGFEDDEKNSETTSSGGSSSV